MQRFITVRTLSHRIPLLSKNIPENPLEYFNNESIMEKCSGCGAEFQDKVPENAGFLKNLSEHRVKWLKKWDLFVRRSRGERVEEEKKKVVKTGFTRIEKERMAKRVEMKEKEGTLTVFPSDAPQTNLSFLSDELIKSCENYSIILNQYPNSKAPVDLERKDGELISPSNIESMFTNPFEEYEAPNPMICTRCFWLRHSGKIANIRPLLQSASEMQAPIWSAQEKSYLKSRLTDKKSIVVLVLDATDFPESLVDITELIQANTEIILVANKVDLLPCENDRDLQLFDKRILEKASSIYGPQRIKDLFLVSAKNSQGISKLSSFLLSSSKAKVDGNIFLVGCTNVGKSMLWNALTDKDSRKNVDATISLEPGTTLGFLEIPLNRLVGQASLTSKGKLIDAPGLLNRSYLGHFLSFDEIKLITPKSKMKPSTYILTPGRSLFVGGLVRVDYANELNESIYMTVVCGSLVPIHVTSTDNAENVYSKHAASHPTILNPPIGGPMRMAFFPPLKPALQFSFNSDKLFEASVDVNISGVGWISLSGAVSQGSLIVHSPDGVGVSTKEPILKYLSRDGVRGGLSGPKKKYFSFQTERAGIKMNAESIERRRDRALTQKRSHRQPIN